MRSSKGSAGIRSSEKPVQLWTLVAGRVDFRGNRIDELDYQIYKSHTADLDKIDILMD